jgi:hypothetical protein
MPDKTNSSQPEPTHAQKFDALLGVVLSVPKAEILRREAEYKKLRAEKRKGISHG